MFPSNMYLDRSTQRSTTSNEATGYQMRKVKKKSVYHEDYAYGTETRKPKDKTKNAPLSQTKKGKNITKSAAAAPATHVRKVLDLNN